MNRYFSRCILDRETAERRGENVETCGRWEGVPRSGEEKTGVCCCQVLLRRTITKRSVTWISFTKLTVNMCSGKGAGGRRAPCIVCKAQGGFENGQQPLTEECQSNISDTAGQ